jgi:cytochrome b561
MTMDKGIVISPARYDRTMVVLHWIVALLIIVLIGTGWYMVGIPKKTPDRAFYFELHKSVGIVAVTFIVLLMVWRAKQVVPPFPSAMPEWERMAANLNHRLFYGLMVLMTLTGYLTSSFSGFGPKFFGIALPHWGWDDAVLRGNFSAVHRMSAFIFAVLIAIHIAAALKHLLVDKDGVFQRMLPP